MGSVGSRLLRTPFQGRLGGRGRDGPPRGDLSSCDSSSRVGPRL